MATKSSEYWQGRFNQVEQSANNKAIKHTRQIEKKYSKAAKEIDTKINAWYQRLADNNGVSVTEAKKLLTNSELKEFKWTVQEYIEAGQQNAIDQRWMKELENASAKFHINRLEALKLECRQSVEQVFANGQESMFNVLGDVYKDTFYHSCFEVQKGVGVGFDVSKLDDNQVSKLLNKPWSVDGNNFSTKLWGNKTKLINNLDQELSRMVLTGSSPKQAIQNIKKAMGSSEYAAKRLVLTEQSYFTTLAQKDSFAELDVEEYENVATLDSATSEICQEQDGKHYPVKDMAPGVNAPPFHPWCRTTTCPYFDDEFSADGMRASRNENGETVWEVPQNMTYKEWEKTFVDGGDKGNLTPIKSEDVVENSVESGTIELPNTSNCHYATKEQYAAEKKSCKKNVTKEDAAQSMKHEKADGSPGGYVATHNYSNINSNMREDGFTINKLDDDDIKTIESLRRAIQSNTLDGDYILTRYVNADYLTSVFGIKGRYNSRDDFSILANSITQVANPYVVNTEIPRITGELKQWIGKKIEPDKAFVSTSMLKDKNIMQDKAVLFNIKAPKGTHAYIPENRKESECILGENTVFAVENVEYDTMVHKWIFDVVVIE